MNRPSARSLLLLLPLVAACTGSMKNKETLGSLEPAVMQFYEQLRWFNGEISKDYVPPAFRSAYLDSLDVAERRFSFNSISVVRITPDKTAKKAVVRLRINWTEKDDNILQDTLVETTWEYHGSAWYHTRGKVVDGPKIPVLFEK
jgi:hypothetical protein